MDSTHFDAEPSFSAERGKTCSVVGTECDHTLNPFIFPDFRLGNGYSIQAITYGPNEGLWWVSNENIGIKTNSWINDGYRTSWPVWQLPEGSDAEECREARELEDTATVFVNFFSFNRLCKERADFAGLIDAMLDHEFGHKQLVDSASRVPSMDGELGIEALVETSADELDTLVVQTLRDIDYDVHVAGAPHPVGNWSATVWLWNNALQRFVESGTWVF